MILIKKKLVNLSIINNLTFVFQDCEACKIKKPECSDFPYPCFEGPPRVDCRDSVDGPVCGPCPPNYKGDGRFCERDACGLDPCFEGVACYAIKEDPYFKCGPCPQVCLHIG